MTALMTTDRAKRPAASGARVFRDRDSILSRVSIDAAAGCWNWTGGDENQYGHPCVRFRRKHMGAHRAVYQALVRNLRDDEKVLHHCDNPRCVNPDHLFVGTQADNMADMHAKGRHPHGEAHGNAVLTVEQVATIRRLYQPGSFGLKRLAAQFGVSKVSIKNIITRKTWKHVA